ncbi:Cytochrome P450 4c21 [Leucoagaricus sp. SymC.cos]|nr:Cytochrome P450 4c21 [Leucoagaricus sp. SymC.cos]
MVNYKQHEPFTVIEWYLGDTTESIAFLENQIVDVAVTYDEVAERQLDEIGVLSAWLYGFRDHFYLIGPAQLFIKIGQVPWAYACSKRYHQYLRFPIQALGAAAILGEYTLSDRGINPTYVPAAKLERMLDAEIGKAFTEWVRLYDAVNPGYLRNILGTVTGYGLLTVTGDEHKQMRKAMNPAFSIPNLMAQTHMYWESIEGLVSILKDQLGTGPDGRVVHVYDWMSKVTLDIICETAFGYKTDSLHNPHNELAVAYEKLIALQSGAS